MVWLGVLILHFNEEALSPFVKKFKTIIHPGEVSITSTLTFTLLCAFCFVVVEVGELNLIPTNFNLTFHGRVNKTKPNKTKLYVPINWGLLSQSYFTITLSQGQYRPLSLPNSYNLLLRHTISIYALPPSISINSGPVTLSHHWMRGNLDAFVL